MWALWRLYWPLKAPIITAIFFFFATIIVYLGNYVIQGCLLSYQIFLNKIVRAEEAHEELTTHNKHTIHTCAPWIIWPLLRRSSGGLSNDVDWGNSVCWYHELHNRETLLAPCSKLSTSSQALNCKWSACSEKQSFKRTTLYDLIITHKTLLSRDMETHSLERVNR